MRLWPLACSCPSLVVLPLSVAKTVAESDCLLWANSRQGPGPSERLRFADTGHFALTSIVLVHCSRYDPQMPVRRHWMDPDLRRSKSVMSAYNLLFVTQTCPVCHQVACQRIQFRYGNCWLHEYKTGDSILWGGNDVGERSTGTVRVSGISVACHNCRSSGEFVVEITNNVIQRTIPDEVEVRRLHDEEVGKEVERYKSSKQ